MKKPMPFLLILSVSILILLQSVVAIKQGNGTFDMRTTLPIMTDEFHTQCNLHAGLNLTMIHCPDKFEVYDTEQLEQQRSLVTNFGEQVEIYGVHNSLATNDRHAITYLEGNIMKRLYRDVSLRERDQVKIESLMLLELGAERNATDAFYLDGMIAVRVNDTQGFEFFLEPLVQFLTIAPLVMDDAVPVITEDTIVEPIVDPAAADETIAPADGEGSLEPVEPLINEDSVETPSEQAVDINSFDFSKLIDYGFARNDYQKVYTLFGISQLEIVKIVYTYDDDAEWISKKVTQQQNINYNGTMMELEVTDEFVIISDSDGVAPGVRFFDHNLNFVDYFPLVRQIGAPYNLAVTTEPEFEMIQLFVAGTNKISIIENVRNNDGEGKFKLYDNVFDSLETQLLESDQTFLAKSGDYLVIKQSSQRNLGLMPICQYKYAYDLDNFSCRPCESALKSYGLQEPLCVSCMRAWVKGTADDFRDAQYEQFCKNGQVYSVILFALVPTLTATATGICCYLHKGNAKKLNIKSQEEIDEKERKKRQKENRYGRKLTMHYGADGATDKQIEMVRQNTLSRTQEINTRPRGMAFNQMSRSQNDIDYNRNNQQNNNEISVTENEHFSVPGSNRGITFQQVNDDFELESHEADAGRDHSHYKERDIRQTAKTNIRSPDI